MTAMHAEVTRAIDQLELAARLLEKADNVGLWVKSDDCSDNRNKRRLLREADWAASDAHRQLIAIGSDLEPEARALVAEIEPLSDVVTDTMLSNPHFDLRIMQAIAHVEALAARVRALLPTAE